MSEKIDRSKLMENEDGNWTTAGSIPFVASECKFTLLSMIKSHEAIRNYKQLLKIDGIYFYGNPGNSGKLRNELVDLEIICLPIEQGGGER